VSKSLDSGIVEKSHKKKFPSFNTKSFHLTSLECKNVLTSGPLGSSKLLLITELHVKLVIAVKVFVLPSHKRPVVQSSRPLTASFFFSSHHAFSCNSCEMRGRSLSRVCFPDPLKIRRGFIRVTTSAILSPSL